jgi:branched-chain amino acid aminotransferase
VALPKFAFFKGKIVQYSEAKVGVMTHALNYGTGAFGGVRAYWNADEEQLYIFRAYDHFTRHSLDLVRAEDFREDIYIRPLVYKSDELIGVRLHDLQSELTIFAIPFKRYVERDDNAHVTFSSWRRIEDNAIPARGKFTGAYINSAFIKTDALRSGFDEALVLTNEGHVSEGSAMNIFMMRAGKLITPPVTDNILEGITRSTIMTLAREVLGLEVEERSIDRTEVFICDELLMTGTAAQVTAVTMVDHRPIADGVMGPVTEQLRKLYDDAVRGKMPAYRDWNTSVYVTEPAIGD